MERNTGFPRKALMNGSVPKAKTQEREIWTAEMLMQALEACDNKMLKIAFHLAFTATLRIGELLGLTWDEMDISEEAIANNRAYVIISKQVERVSRNAVEALNSKEIILIFPTSKKNNKTVRVLKTPKTDSSSRKVYIPRSVAQCLVELKAEQDEIKEALGTETEWRRYQGRPGRFRTCSGRHGNRSIWPHY